MWRYLLQNYFQVLFFCVFSFIAVLLVTRFQEIARFAATGAPKAYLLLFILFQIPSILPLAIPISCLISSILLIQRLSRSFELTAMRASGLSLYSIIFPLLIGGALLSIANFTIASELSPKCHSLSKALAYQVTAGNPLSVLGKDSLIKLKNTYVDMRLLKSGRYAKDLILVQRNLSHNRLGIVVAKELGFENSDLLGKEVTLITSLAPKEQKKGFDHLVIEHQSSMRIKAQELLQYLRSSEWNIGEEYLPFRMLAVKGKERSFQEMARRISLGFAAFTFTLIGLGYGLEIGRRHSLKGLFWGVGLGAFFLVAFMAAKSFKHTPMAGILCYLLPHLIIGFFALRAIKKISHGVEA